MPSSLAAAPSTATMAPSALMGPPVPPPGTNFLLAIKPGLDDILIGHTFTILLIPLIIALFGFSSRQSRVAPIFILNVFTIALAFAVGCILDARAYRSILQPANQPPLSWNLVTGVLGLVQNVLVDVILLLRLLAVYPRDYIGTKRWSAMITLPIVLKIMRVINIIIFTVLLSRAANGGATADAQIQKIWENAPYLKIEWFAQLFDNSYASILFLWRLVLRNRENKGVNTGSSSDSFTSKLRVLFWIAFTNFVIPSLFSLIQIVIVYREVDPVVVNEIVLVNTSISVISVVFATIWAGSSRRKDEQYYKSSSTSKATPQQLSTVVFKQGRSATTTYLSDVQTTQVAGSGGTRSWNSDGQKSGDIQVVEEKVETDDGSGRDL